MPSETKTFSTAVSLMKMALALLDKSGAQASVTACHLQSAIDTALGVQPMQVGDDIDPAVIERLLSPPPASDE